MKQISTCMIVLAFGLVGCAPKETVVTGPNGEKVSVSQNGSNVKEEVTGANGEKVEYNANNNGVSMKSNKGEVFNMNTGGVTEDTLGLPFYPGSQEKPNGSVFNEDAKAKTVISMRTTKDDPDKVTEFYKDKLESSNSSAGSGANMKMSALTGKLKNGADVAVQAMKSGTEDTAITITVKTGKGGQ